MINIHISPEELALLQAYQAEVDTYLAQIVEANMAAEMAFVLRAKSAYDVIDTIRTRKMVDLCIMYFKLGQMFNVRD